MKQSSKEQIEKKVALAFEAYPAAKKIFATRDGNTFLDKNRAELYAGKSGTVYPFDRPKEETESVTASQQWPTAREAIAAIVSAETTEKLKPFKADERKTVKAAYEKRVKELETVIEKVSVTQQMPSKDVNLAGQAVKTGDKINKLKKKNK